MRISPVFASCEIAVIRPLLSNFGSKFIPSSISLLADNFSSFKS